MTSHTGVKCDCSGIGDGVSPSCPVHARGVLGTSADQPKEPK